MDTLVLITQYSFMVTMLGMAAATVYMLIERDGIAAEYRPAVTVAGIYTAIAAFMYWNMYTQVGLDGDIQSILDLPTHVRYVDWIITTPLILLTIALVLEIPQKRLGLVLLVLAADVAMIIFGYFGELYSNEVGMQFQAWTMFGAGCLAYLLLLFIVLSFFADTASEKVAPVQRAFRLMALFIAIGWTVYPIGFLFGMSDAEIMKVAREFVYNIADIINKIGLGVVTISAVVGITRDAQVRQAMRDL